ncbi:MAG: phosphonoacetaldehyde reductase [Dechloromonas sp.]|nr:MAG: phosphonoacetaldehyde reductase [Dechloromonas sp.]
MNSVWSFHHPTRITFGVGCVPFALEQVPYRRMLLVTTPGMHRRGTSDWLREACRGKVTASYEAVKPNPEMADLDDLALRYKEGNFDAVLALGGGSALDTGKILAVLLGAGGEFTLRGHFFAGDSMSKARPLPVIAIPTTAGTGSEVTPFATVWDIRNIKKFSLAHPTMFPAYALLDPALTHELPWNTTLATGLDAFTQACESVWNRNANPITLGFAYEAARLAWEALSRGEDIIGSIIYRTKLMEASLLAGLAISHTRTALCHSMSYPITARFGLSHGLACGFTLPAVLRYNSESDDGRLRELARRLGHASVDDLTSAIAELLRRLGVWALVQSAVGGSRQLWELESDMITPGRADNNLRPVETGALKAILDEAMRDLGAVE